MPFYVRFTKVKQKIDICKKSKENFIFLSFSFRFEILKSKVGKLCNVVSE